MSPRASARRVASVRWGFALHVLGLRELQRPAEEFAGLGVEVAIEHPPVGEAPGQVQPLGPLGRRFTVGGSCFLPRRHDGGCILGRQIGEGGEQLGFVRSEQVDRVGAEVAADRFHLPTRQGALRPRPGGVRELGHQARLLGEFGSPAGSHAAVVDKPRGHGAGTVDFVQRGGFIVGDSSGDASLELVTQGDGTSDYIAVQGNDQVLDGVPQLLQHTISVQEFADKCHLWDEHKASYRSAENPPKPVSRPAASRAAARRAWP
jgi:hypothetical protein